MTVSGAGAFSTNTITNTIRALIDDGSRVTSSGGNVIVSARQSSHGPNFADAADRFSVIAAAGELTAAGSGGAIGGVDVLLGAAFAKNQIINTGNGFRVEARRLNRLAVARQPDRRLVGHYRRSARRRQRSLRRGNQL